MCRLEEGDEMTQYPTNEETVVLVLGVLQDLILNVLRRETRRWRC